MGVGAGAVLGGSSCRVSATSVDQEPFFRGRLVAGRGCLCVGCHAGPGGRARGLGTSSPCLTTTTFSLISTTCRHAGFIHLLLRLCIRSELCISVPSFATSAGQQPQHLGHHCEGCGACSTTAGSAERGHAQHRGWMLSPKGTQNPVFYVLSNKSRDRGSSNAWQQVAAAGPHLKPQVFGNARRTEVNRQDQKGQHPNNTTGPHCWQHHLRRGGAGVPMIPEREPSQSVMEVGCGSGRVLHLRWGM